MLLLEEVPESEAPGEEGVGQNTAEQAEHCLTLQWGLQLGTDAVVVYLNVA